MALIPSKPSTSRPFFEAFSVPTQADILMASGHEGLALDFTVDLGADRAGHCSFSESPFRIYPLRPIAVGPPWSNGLRIRSAVASILPRTGKFAKRPPAFRCISAQHQALNIPHDTFDGRNQKMDDEPQ